MWLDCQGVPIDFVAIVILGCHDNDHQIHS